MVASLLIQSVPERLIFNSFVHKKTVFPAERQNEVIQNLNILSTDVPTVL